MRASPANSAGWVRHSAPLLPRSSSTRYICLCLFVFVLCSFFYLFWPRSSSTRWEHLFNPSYLVLVLLVYKVYLFAFVFPFVFSICLDQKLVYKVGALVLPLVFCICFGPEARIQSGRRFCQL